MTPVPERDLLLTRAWIDSGRRVWLALDLVSGTRTLELSTLDAAPSGAPGAILIGGEPDTCLALPDGALRLGEGVLWSLLDPRQTASPTSEPASEQIAVETSLREGATRFRRRLAWWRELDPTLRESCRRGLSGHAPNLTGLLDLFDAIPASPMPAPPPASAPAAANPSTTANAVSCPLDPEELFGWFTAASGLGAVVGTEFTSRAEQAAMAREIALALAQGQPLLVEAGTGVGKTLAYLAPLLATVNAGGGRAVVSTHTRALQSQIMTIDLPRLRPLLGEKRFQLLMGRRNYLCLRQRQAYLTRPISEFADALRIVAFRLWLAETLEGTRDEIAGHALLRRDVDELFEAADLCLPGMCYDGERCYVQRARRRAREADILVVNHSLLLHDRRTRGSLLGEYQHLVVDEAHRLPPVLLDTHGVACGLWRLAEFEDLLGRTSTVDQMPERLTLTVRRLAAAGPAGESAAASVADFDAGLRRVQQSFRLWWQALGGRVDEGLAMAGRDQGRVRVRDKDEFFGPIRPESAALLENLAAAAGAYATLASRAAQIPDLSGGLEDDLAQVAQAGQLLQLLQQDVNFLLHDPDEEWVTWLEPGRRRGAARLGATLLEAGNTLREYWQDADLRPIMTSATLAVGDDFNHMLQELGLSRRRPATTTWTSPSPFDYRRQTLVLTPTRFPDPGAGGFGAAVGSLLALLAAHAPRKTLGLFTSYRAIGQAADAMAAAGFGTREDTDTGDPIVLAQMPGAATGELLARFRRQPRAILLGTATFWEGVDFPGEDLEILVVTKLPFLVPTDPWVEARCERIQAAGDNPFTTFMVRDAVLRLRQGFGRLIRRTSDRGVVLILDNRLHTKNYGTTFLGALPAIPAAFGDDNDLIARIDEFFRRP